eukprot:m.101014 g.101014  ORF g.101014 m.101014 type:complete len:53 (+) comp10372_c0_seq2:3614-3772(+)
MQHVVRLQWQAERGNSTERDAVMEPFERKHATLGNETDFSTLSCACQKLLGS